MDLTKTLLIDQIDINCNEYILRMNKLVPFNVDDNLLTELLEIMDNEYIHHILLKKFNIINDDTDIPLFLQKYSDIILKDSKDNYYIPKHAFINIILNETISLCAVYILITQYKILYHDYQDKLGKLLELKSNFYKMENILSLPNLDNELRKEIEVRKNDINNEINNLLQ